MKWPEKVVHGDYFSALEIIALGQSGIWSGSYSVHQGTTRVHLSASIICEHVSDKQEVPERVEVNMNVICL